MKDSHWHVAAASVQGTSHQKQSVPCQDACAYRVLADGILLIAVADGAGSAAHADEGAQLAVQQSLATLEASLLYQRPADDDAWQGLLRSAFQAAREQLLAFAAQIEQPPQTLATTLTCAIIHSDGVHIGRIGDGAVIVELADQTLLATTLPPRGEYANETYFLTHDDALAQFEFQMIKHTPRAVAVTTDGLIRLAFKLPEGTPHQPFFRPLFAFVAELTDEQTAQAELATFLASERVCARTDDDKTLVIAVCATSQSAPLAREAA